MPDLYHSVTKHTPVAQCHHTHTRTTAGFPAGPFSRRISRYLAIFSNSQELARNWLFYYFSPGKYWRWKGSQDWGPGGVSSHSLLYYTLLYSTLLYSTLLYSTLLYCLSWDGTLGWGMGRWSGVVWIGPGLIRVIDETNISISLIHIFIKSNMAHIWAVRERAGAKLCTGQAY